MSNLALIQAQPQDFTTCQVTDWLDGLSLIATPGAGGVIAGSANVGQGSLAVASVDAGAELGVHVATVSGIVNGLTHFTVTDPDGDITGQGVVGLPLYAGGITFTLNQVANQAALAVDDTFAIAVLPVPVDLTGITFTLDSRVSSSSAIFALQASSAPSDGSTATIVNGGAAGTVAMRVPQGAMAACPPSAPTYPYNIFAADPATGQRVIAFYGQITHLAVFQPQD